MKKRRYKKKAIPIRIGEEPPKEREQHQGGLISEIIDRMPNGKAILKRMRAKAECVLDIYLIRQILNVTEYRAASKFRRAYLHAVLHIKTHDAGAGNHGDYEQAALTLTESEETIRNAYSVLDMTEKAVIISVCGHDDWSGGAYRMNSFHTGLAKLIELWRIS